MKTVLLTVALLLSTTVAAQVAIQPTPPPSVTAAGTSWYRNQEPIFYSGNFYYPSGPNVYFSPNHMAATGQYNGVPLYEDKTIEPFSMVFVPIGGGLMRPYERRRDGALAGTSGSVASPRFPSVTPPALEPVGARGVSDPRPVGTAGVESLTAAERRALAPPRIVATAIPPRGNRGFSITYAGSQWTGARQTVRFDPARFEHIGEYRGFPVYAERGADRTRVIYLPVVADKLAMYRRVR